MKAVFRRGRLGFDGVLDEGPRQAGISNGALDLWINVDSQVRLFRLRSFGARMNATERPFIEERRP